MKNSREYFTYLLLCSDGTWYTGWTVNLEKRLAAHNDGSASRYTRSRRPVRLLHFWNWPTQGEAMSAEVTVKKLSRVGKEALLSGTKVLVSIEGKVLARHNDETEFPASCEKNIKAEIDAP